MTTLPPITLEQTENLEPANKRMKSGDLSDIIDECYDLKFNDRRPPNEKSEEDKEKLKAKLQTIRETLEQANSSRDVSFGSSRVLAKINWAKCLSLLLDGGVESIKALSILTGRLNPGAGLL